MEYRPYNRVKRSTETVWHSRSPIIRGGSSHLAGGTLSAIIAIEPRRSRDRELAIDTCSFDPRKHGKCLVDRPTRGCAKGGGVPRARGGLTKRRGSNPWRGCFRRDVSNQWCCKMELMLNETVIVRGGEFVCRVPVDGLRTPRDSVIR